MRERVWDFWANRYSKLWVQKYSLKPTRLKVKAMIVELELNSGSKLLDVGCGVGELLGELKDIKGLSLHGLDFSRGMIHLSQKANPSVVHYQMDVRDMKCIDEEFDIIVCTHSLPYHKSQLQTLKDIHSLLRADGILVIAFASANSILDKLLLSFVKLTTGSARYINDSKFRDLCQGLFDVESMDRIRLKSYMPNISIYKLRKVNCENTSY